VMTSRKRSWASLRPQAICSVLHIGVLLWCREDTVLTGAERRTGAEEDEEDEEDEGTDLALVC
jgi:hypothetical protein